MYKQIRLEMIRANKKIQLDIRTGFILIILLFLTIIHLRLFVEPHHSSIKKEYIIRLYHILRQSRVFRQLFVELAKIFFFLDYNTEFVHSTINRILFFGYLSVSLDPAVV